MKYIKMLGLLAVEAAAVMAVAGTASATTITSSGGETPTIIAASTHFVLHNPSLGTETTCTESTFEGTVESHGSGVPASGRISRHTFANCGNSHVTVLHNGSFSIVGNGTTGNGTVTLTGSEITITNTTVGVSCVYKTSNTHAGNLIGGTPPIWNLGKATIPRPGHSFFCGAHGFMTGTYTVTSPGSLSVH